MADPNDNTQDSPELAPNMWFTEYDMPFTNVILESEAAYAKENPDAVAGERDPIAQFIIDQETAVARDYAAGEISEAEFNEFKEMSEGRLEAIQERLETELDELAEDGEDWAGDFVKSFEGMAQEHRPELESLVAKAENGTLQDSDISLHLAADMLGTTFEGVDKLYEILPEHLHDVVDVLETETLDTAHAMLDAREELSSADEHNLEREREELDDIQPTFEAEMDEVHEVIDADFERMDVEIEHAKEFADTAREHAEMNPDTTVEHMPYQVIDDYDAIDQMEEETDAQV